MSWKMALLGIDSSHTRSALLAVITIATYGRWTFNHQQLNKGPSCLKEFRLTTEASWSNLHHGRPPANFGQSGTTFIFLSLMTSQQEC